MPDSDQGNPQTPDPTPPNHDPNQGRDKAQGGARGGRQRLGGRPQTQGEARGDGPVINPLLLPYEADNFVSPNTAFLEIETVELPIKDAELKRSCKRPSVRNHKTRGHPLSVQGGFDGTVTFRMPVTTGVYELEVGNEYEMKFAYNELDFYSVFIAITEINDSIPDQDGEDPPMYEISAILEGQIMQLGILGPTTP